MRKKREEKNAYIQACIRKYACILIYACKPQVVWVTNFRSCSRDIEEEGGRGREKKRSKERKEERGWGEKAIV